MAQGGVVGDRTGIRTGVQQAVVLRHVPGAAPPSRRVGMEPLKIRMSLSCLASKILVLEGGRGRVSQKAVV